MKVKLSRWMTLPIPDLDFSSRRFNVEIEADSWEEADHILDELEKREVSKKIPDYILSNDKLASLKRFLTKLSTDKKIWPEVQQKWREYIEEVKNNQLPNQ